MIVINFVPLSPVSFLFNVSSLGFGQSNPFSEEFSFFSTIRQIIIELSGFFFFKALQEMSSHLSGQNSAACLKLGSALGQEVCPSRAHAVGVGSKDLLAEITLYLKYLSFNMC